MAPPQKFNREEILKAALSLVRTEGAGALTARRLAEVLHSSPKPIFGLFTGMEEVRAGVLQAARDCYRRLSEQMVAEGELPPYKAIGMAYIRFASQEPELFRLLFMRDRRGEASEGEDAGLTSLYAMLSERFRLDAEEARLFHAENWIFVHGIAVMIATSYLDWSEEMCSRVLSDAYQGLKYRFTVQKKEGENSDGKP